MATILEKIKKIEHGKGIQYILDEAFKIYGNPILIHDMDYRLIAYTNCVMDDPIWCDYMQYGSIQQKTLEFITEESFVDDVANSTGKDGVTFLKSDKLKHDRIFGQLYNKKREAVADLVMVEYATKFDIATKAEVKALCEALSKELSASDFYNDYGQNYKETIIKKLIDNTIEDTRFYSGHVANLDVGLKGSIYLAIVDISQSKEPNKQIYYRDMLKKLVPLYDYYIYCDMIIVLVSSEDTISEQLNSIKPFKKLFDKENIFSGISSQFDNLFQLQKFYLQAEQALNAAKQDKNNNKIYIYRNSSESVPLLDL